MIKEITQANKILRAGSFSGSGEIECSVGYKYEIKVNKAYDSDIYKLLKEGMSRADLKKYFSFEYQIILNFESEFLNEDFYHLIKSKPINLARASGVFTDLIFELESKVYKALNISGFEFDAELIDKKVDTGLDDMLTYNNIFQTNDEGDYSVRLEKNGVVITDRFTPYCFDEGIINWDDFAKWLKQAKES